MKKAIIYCRSATADQQSDAQLSRQKGECLEFAREHNYEVIETVSEAGVSGMDQSRKGLQKLLALCGEHAVTAVITYDIERLSRDWQQINKLLQTFADKHIELVTLKSF
ncbi:MAG: recombinase family protein [Anaerolineae bacterium]|nr:recombinase family protein [Anaerolineae bacterium]